jgi:alginate O-acetyltransferase complex protein AlgI
MVFSSDLFLYGFLPIFFSLYYLIADRRKNWLILIASLVFYGIGAGSTVLVLLVSIFVNHSWRCASSRHRRLAAKRCWRSASRSTCSVSAITNTARSCGSLPAGPRWVASAPQCGYHAFQNHRGGRRQ